VSLGFLVLGCTDNSGTVTPVDLKTRAAFVDLGLGDDAFTDQFLLDVQRDVEVRAAECMRDRGFEFEQRPPEASVGTGPAFVSTSVEFAENYGFGLSMPPSFEPQSITDVNFDTYQLLTTAERSAWDLAESTCYQTARDDSYTQSGRAAVDGLYEDVLTAALADPTVVAAWEDWKACVERAGIETVAPYHWTLVDEFQARWEQVDQNDAAAVERFRSEEFAAAKAAAECAEPVWPQLADARFRKLELIDPVLADAVDELRG
jgi:hypothetical protein